MFNKIFRQITNKYYIDKLSEICENNLYDVYSILIMI